MRRISCPVECVTPGDGQWFVGYYDKRPWSADGHRLLVHRAPIIDRVPGERDLVEVGSIDLRDPARPFTMLAKSSLWNWQQGTMLSWLPGADDTVVYNARLGDPGLDDLSVWQIGAGIVHNLNTGERRALQRPIYTLSPKGDAALTLSFARLACNRPDYGHFGVEDPTTEDAAPDDDGVYRIDMATGEARLILSIEDVAEHKPADFGVGRTHWVNHLMYNPSGKRFCFLHRFWREDGNMHTRLFTACAHDGSDLRLVFEGMISHFDWLDDHTLLAWAGERRLLAPSAPGRRGIKHHALRSLKPIYHALGKPRWLMSRVVGDSYMLLRDDGSAPERFARGVLTTDGHCTLSRDRAWMLTDGYTDRLGRLPLYLLEMATCRATRIGRFPTPRRLDGPIRCDLHPRLRDDAACVCIDTAAGMQRRVCLVDVSGVTRSRRG
ncbi:MAG: hypothetical protein H6814_00445 [Phycisphaeraceae bacterium]|nr:hypothetical protein [Phycisphaeraceae bacterium]